MIKNTNFAFIRPPYSREDHYCFEFSVNDMEKTSLGYKYIVHNQCMHDQHVSNIKQINGPCIIKAKVYLK